MDECGLLVICLQKESACSRVFSSLAPATFVYMWWTETPTRLRCLRYLSQHIINIAEHHIVQWGRNLKYRPCILVCIMMMEQSDVRMMRHNWRCWPSLAPSWWGQHGRKYCDHMFRWALWCHNIICHQKYFKTCNLRPGVDRNSSRNIRKDFCNLQSNLQDVVHCTEVGSLIARLVLGFQLWNIGL